MIELCYCSRYQTYTQTALNYHGTRLQTTAANLYLEKYVVERMDEATGRWVNAGETDGPQTSLAVDGLTPGHKYKFRVRAVNRSVFFTILDILIDMYLGGFFVV